MATATEVPMLPTVSPNGSKGAKRHDGRRRKSADELASLYDTLYRLAADEG
jgi:hypothetical protein